MSENESSTPQPSHIPVPVPEPSNESSADNGMPAGEGDTVPTRNEILAKLAKMPGLIAVGILPPARSNAMKGVYHTLLANLNDGTAANAAVLPDETLLHVLRTDPAQLKALQPFLTPEQMELIMREGSR